MHYTHDTIYKAIEKTSVRYPDSYSYIFLSKKTRYKVFLNKIITCAKALKAQGIEENDYVAIIMPNSPQALIMLYAINCIGAIATMIHPLSSEKDIAAYLDLSNSKTVLTLDVYKDKVLKESSNRIKKLILTSIVDESSSIKKIAYKFKNRKDVCDNKCISWKDFLNFGKAYKDTYYFEKKSQDLAIILFTGGTSGVPKGVMLSNYALNALAQQNSYLCESLRPGSFCYSGMPIFHGFGLAAICHSMFFSGVCCLLIPKIHAANIIHDIVKYKCNIFAGVPSLFEIILKFSNNKSYDLSSLQHVFSGGDSLSEYTETKFNEFLKDNGSDAKIRIAYGITESVTAVTITPADKQKLKSSGLPYPDTTISICIPGTQTQVPVGQKGEICVHGPTLMLGYLNNISETKQVLQKHPDGKTWLHTGDLGYLDKDGFLFFVQRIKRVIVSNGYNIYPTQIENVFNSHKFVSACCAIGVPDTIKGQKVKVFIKLKNNIPNTVNTKNKLMEYVVDKIAKYALPDDIEFREELPKTLIGKIDFKALEDEEESKCDLS